MIANSPLIKLLAVGGALAAHAALAMALLPQTTVSIDGSGGAAEVRLGTAFADMSAGVLQAMPADTAAAPAPRATPEAAQIETALTASPPGEPAPRAEMARPAPQAPRSGAAPTPAASLTAAEAPRPQPAAAAPPAPRAPSAVLEAPAAPIPRAAAAPVVPRQSASPAAIAPTLTELHPAGRLAPSSPSPETAGPQPELADPVRPDRNTAEADTALTSRSLRPRQRSAAFEETHQPKPREIQRQAAKPAPQAKSSRTQRAGSSGSSPKATAKSSGSGQTKRAAGTAAASNYPGMVMRRVAQVGRVRVRASGAAVVAFTVSSSGRLAALSLTRSSGNAALDQAALRQIRRAVPFPKPPAGAQRSFRITIKGQ